MTNETKNTKELVTVKDTVAAVTATAGAAAVAAITGSFQIAVVTALATFMPAVFAVAGEAAVRHKRGQYDRMFTALAERWAEDENMTSEEVAGFLEAHKEEPWVHDTVWRTVRSLMEAADDAATVPLGLLAQEYMRDKQRPDAYFRGTVRLLQELNAEEFRELRAMLDWVLAETVRPIVIVTARGGGAHSWRLYIMRDVEGDGDAEAQNETAATMKTADVVSEPERLFALLEGTGIGLPPRADRWGGGFPDVRLERVVAERLRRLLGSD
jgi:hypothetical protein